ncbi:hypothetical protein IAG44_20465 [Streptomyces roseirectus]|uniref:Uncharacterized protein n=1 Tax=Streptomyces roseirectus TaxID=2768066 RepID=A0A7H0IFK1_9ACTN|nr:hypothetical protein [Streptomyces roseirectus]QNP71567.1 hypothetical protein IAG44_20465 [Streptomyces roseirectus]
MSLNISFALLFGVIVVVLIRGNSVKAGPAITCVLFGFFLASSSLAPSIGNLVTGVADAISQIRL